MRKIIITYLLVFLGRSWAFIYTHNLNRKMYVIKAWLYTGWISKEFKSIGRNTMIYSFSCLTGGNYITIGDKCIIGKKAVLTAWDKYGNDKFQPQITIGDNVSIGDDSHITAINRIEIGNNVLTGRKITITDHSHGNSDFSMLFLAPILRPLFSEGPVIIEDGVWIGDKVTILPNVRIGRNSIVGANAVVTRDIPANSVVGGIPARIIKEIKEQ